MPHTSDDSCGGDIIAAACVHSGATVAQPYIEGHYDSRNGIVIRGGHIDVPAGPGLGIVPDEAMFSNEVASF